MNTDIQELYSQKQELENAYKNVESKCYTLHDTSDILYEYKIDDDIILNILTLAHKLYDESCIIAEKIKNLNDIISEYQAKCNHDMQYIGHDSHRDFYECCKCGYRTKY